MAFRVALPKLPTMGKVCDTNYRTVCERKREREREQQIGEVRERETAVAGGSYGARRGT